MFQPKVPKTEIYTDKKKEKQPVTQDDSSVPPKAFRK